MASQLFPVAPGVRNNLGSDERADGLPLAGGAPHRRKNDCQVAAVFLRFVAQPQDPRKWPASRVKQRWTRVQLAGVASSHLGARTHRNGPTAPQKGEHYETTDEST